MNSNPASTTSPRQYAVFISYRHADNLEMGRKWANWLHEALESYEVPPDLIGKTSLRGDPVPASLYPVFRDEAELPADADLSTNIRRALENSGLLVVLCSPRAVQSRFVEDEIRYFKELGKSDRMLALMLDGEPNASDDPGKVASFGAEAECFPYPLRFGVPVDGDARKIDWNARTEPIAADVRPGGHCVQGWTTAAAYREQLVKEGKLTARQINDAVQEFGERLELAKLKVIAGALGLPLGELTQRDKAFQLAKAKRRQKIIMTAAVVFGVLAVLAAGAGWIAWEMRGRATAKAHELSDTLGIYSFYEGTNRLTNHETTGEALAYLARGAREYGNQNCADRILTFIQQRPLWVLVPSDRKRPAVAEPAEVPASGIKGPPLEGVEMKVLMTAAGPEGMTAAVWGDEDTSMGSPCYFRVWDAKGKALTPWIEPKFEAMTRSEHVSRIDFSPDGLYVAVCVQRWREPEFLQVFHVPSGKQVGDTLEATGEGSHVQSASFTHVSFTRSRARGDEKNGALLAGSSRGDVYWMDLTVSAEGEATSYKEALVPHHYAVWAATLVKDGEYKDGDAELLVSGSEDGRINLTRAGDGARGVQAGTLNAGGKVEAVYVDADGAVEVVVEGGRQMRLVKIPNLDLGLKMPEVPEYEAGESKPEESVIAAKKGAKVQFTIPDGIMEEQMGVFSSPRVQPVPLSVRVTHADKSVACYGVDASYKSRLLAKGAGSLLTLRGSAPPVDVGKEIADITPGPDEKALTVGFADFSYRVLSASTGAPLSALMDEKLFFAQGGQPDAVESMLLSASGKRLLTRSQHWEPPNAMLSYLMVWDTATGVPMTDRRMYADDGGDDQPYEGRLYMDDVNATADGMLRHHAQAEEFAVLAEIAENLAGLRLTESREFQAVAQQPEVVRGLFERLRGK
ncbi:TIR domain-containing protein [Prosthecobacter fluviatilis]|uniref:TIR domain-containing protein n=1 Tax=Prosthecobacter fluviatilis TaxID=445931 RepID=A0ABW0KV72_9BACT